jgi:uncharacterized membrane protein YjgN (DUF898 family)
MEITSENKHPSTAIKYDGKSIEFALIFFKNLLLTLFTLGLYYPWAKVAVLNYHYKSSELNEYRFQFDGTGKEVFKGFIKIYAPIILLYAFILYGSQTQNDTFLFISLAVFYLFLILIIPFAIHGCVRYYATKSSWRGIYFKYLGSRSEFFWMCLKGISLTILTLGIYSSWFQVDLRKYLFSHIRFGNLSFNFKGKGVDLFWITIKFFLLFYLTLGIYSFWYFKNLWHFYADNTTVTQDGKTVNFKLKATTADVFELLFINGILILFTLGIATPWVLMRTLKFFFKFAEIDGYIDTNAIQQVTYNDFDTAKGDSTHDFLDFDLV